MNWKQEAVGRLKSYGQLQRATLTIPGELARLEKEALDLRASGCREGQLMDNVALRLELRWNLEQANSFLRITDQALKQLGADQRALLERLYIHPQWGNVNSLSLDLGIARATVYRRRDAALRSFATALYGKAGFDIFGNGGIIKQ